MLRKSFADRTPKACFLRLCQEANSSIVLCALPHQSGWVAGELGLSKDEGEERPVTVRGGRSLRDFRQPLINLCGT